MIGAFLMAVITNGAVLLNITQYYQQVIIGVIIWLAVWWDQVRRRRLSADTGRDGRREDQGDEPTRRRPPMRRSSLAALLIAVACAAAGCGVVKTHNAKITLRSTPPVHLAVIPKSVGLDYWSKVHAGAPSARPRRCPE